MYIYKKDSKSNVTQSIQTLGKAVIIALFINITAFELHRCELYLIKFSFSQQAQV